MTLSHLLTQAFGIINLPALEICELCLDSRAARSGALFLAYPGIETDGREYIGQAIGNGATAILYENRDGFVFSYDGVFCLGVPNLQSQVSSIADVFYGAPSESIGVLGVTGTNGKTSVCHFLAQALATLGYQVGIMGTVGSGLWPDLVDQERTTADAITVQKTLAALKAKGAQYCVMEVSSHALEQGRVAAVRFQGAAFTNLSRDHLDYHGSMEAYFKAKQALFFFPSLQWAVVNSQDAYGERLLYALNDGAVDACSVINWTEKLSLAQRNTLKIVGQFQLDNANMACTMLGKLGVAQESLFKVLPTLQPVQGRLEVVHRAPLIVIDYAHTPEALKAALQAVKPYVKGTLWVVFGCGGNRDKGKRPLMAKVAETYADQVVVTADNPRMESVALINQDIMAGFSNKTRVISIEDRAQAIRFVCKQLQPDDGVLLAGKGHERYQVVGRQSYSFDERKIVAEVYPMFTSFPS